MALHRSSLSARRGSRNDSQKDEDESENNGYVQILVKPLEQSSCNIVCSWLGCTGANFTNQQVGIVYGFGLVILSIIVYQLLKCDLGFIFHRLCGIIVPIFTIVCVFYWLSLFLRKTWSTTSVYILFSSCYVGETFALLFLSSWRTNPDDNPVNPEQSTGYVMQPSVIFVVLLVICTASVVSTLEIGHSVVVISLVSFTRFLACSMLSDLPYGLRPFVAYSCGLTGIIVSKYMETVLKPPINNFMTHDGKIPVIKRRRSSSSSQHAFSAHRSTRRTSLPALIPKSQSSSAGYESAIIGEAHGLITDMLADNTLPPHIISGLRAVSNLLKPQDVPMHKQRVSPLVSLAESSSYGSDMEESPYTGERPSSLPKRLRRSLPPNLIRRMSASTWTTTTSATGMPTLELEPCRIRSSSFRHSRDNTPGSSPVGSRSSSPSPSSPTVVLTIPKSRSFSLASPTPMVASHAKRLTRKSMAPAVPISEISTVSPGRNDNRVISPLAKAEVETVEEGDRLKSITVSKDQFTSLRRLNITSDYESSDSPNSSDHSDTVLTADDLSGSPPKKLSLQHSMLMNVESPESRVSGDQSRVIHDEAEEEAATHDEEEDEDDEDFDVEIDIDSFKKPEITSKDKEYLYIRKDIKTKEKEKVKSVSVTDKFSDSEVVWDVSEVEDYPLLQTHCLSTWDYPIFELAEKNPNCILSKVAYRLFMEVGLFETFRIPISPFIQYFHALELGYRNKPYHNRVHATDVLHGVFYMTTQPIPGFTQVNTSDMFSRHGSSSESESDNIERSNTYRSNNFSADDSYGIMGGNFPALELMALYTAAAMHDYDHPGRTNAFLVATNAPQAILYNDRSVLENHHAASAWNLFLAKPGHNFLCGLEQAEFKRFRFLVIEAILATDLKRHFEILAEFNAKVNDDDAPGIDWTVETDRHLVTQMVIKLADINGPAKKRDLHMQWTTRISEEFYEQGDEEVRLGMAISPYMDRHNGQLAKLQETFINHLVAPLCNSLVTGGLLPGTWVDEDSEDGDSMSDTEKGESTCKDTEDEENDETDPDSGSMGIPKNSRRKTRKVNCLLTKNLKENHEIWVAKIEQEKQAAASEKKDITPGQDSCEKPEMEPIKEESESPVSPSSISESDATNADENGDPHH